MVTLFPGMERLATLSRSSGRTFRCERLKLCWLQRPQPLSLHSLPLLGSFLNDLMDISHSLYIPFLEHYYHPISTTSRAYSPCLLGSSLPPPRCRDAICRWTNVLCLSITMAASLLLFDSRLSSHMHDCVHVTMHSWCYVSVCNACSTIRES